MRVSTCPQKRAVNGVECLLLEIYEAHEERHSCLPPNFLQPANHKQTSCPWSIDPVETRTASPEISFHPTVSVASPGNHLKENLTRV